MDVNAVNATTAANPYAPPPTNNQPTPPVPATDAVNEKPAAVYEPGEKNQVYKPDMNRIKQMWAEHDQRLDSFRRLIEGLLNKQAQRDGIASNWQDQTAFDPDRMVEIDEETRAAALAEISEGGYFSVEETAARIVGFAVAISGGDPAVGKGCHAWFCRGGKDMGQGVARHQPTNHGCRKKWF
jgi:hypothetical protein